MRLSLDEFKQIVSMVTAKEKKPIVVELPVIKNESITISVEADEQGNLVYPIEVGRKTIKTLGIYQIDSNKIWVIKR